MIRLRLRMDPDKSFRKMLDAKAKGLASWAQHGEILGAHGAFAAIEAHHERVFASEGSASTYGPWAVLRNRTLRARASLKRMSRIAPFDYRGAAGARTGILTWSARARNSLATQGNMYGDSVRRSRRTGLTFGTSTPTLLFHAAGRKNMPIRLALDDVGGFEAAMPVIERRILAFVTS